MVEGRRVTPAYLVLAGATVLMVAGGTSAGFQDRHRHPLFGAVVVGLVAVAGGAAAWWGGWA